MHLSPYDAKIKLLSLALEFNDINTCLCMALTLKGPGGGAESAPPPPQHFT